MYAISRVLGNAIIAEWEDRKMDWFIITSETLS
jgi:hypothetical protein